MPESHWLRPDIKLEPLFFGCYAWSHLLAPAPAYLYPSEPTRPTRA